MFIFFSISWNVCDVLVSLAGPEWRPGWVVGLADNHIAAAVRTLAVADTPAAVLAASKQTKHCNNTLQNTLEVNILFSFWTKFVFCEYLLVGLGRQGVGLIQAGPVRAVVFDNMDPTLFTNSENVTYFLTLLVLILFVTSVICTFSFYNIKIWKFK